MFEFIALIYNGNAQVVVRLKAQNEAEMHQQLTALYGLYHCIGFDVVPAPASQD